LSKNYAWRSSGAYIVPGRFGKQYIILVNPIEYTSVFITGGLTGARNIPLDIQPMITEHQLFPHNSLRANIFQPLLLAHHATPKIQGSQVAPRGTT
jgi:hypothetical protein